MPKRPLPEARKTLRRLMRRAAEVMLPGQDSPVPCVILDISNGGARLAIGHPSAEIPRTFTLVLYKDRSALRECELVWLDRRHVGVKFISKWYAAVGPERPSQASSPGQIQPAEDDTAQLAIQFRASKSRRLQ
jgi:PilZ domain